MTIVILYTIVVVFTPIIIGLAVTGHLHCLMKGHRWRLRGWSVELCGPAYWICDKCWTWQDAVCPRADTN